MKRLVVIGIAIGLGLFLWGKWSRIKVAREIQVTRVYTPNIIPEVKTNYITLTTEYCPWVEIPEGYTIKSKFTTPNLYWQTYVAYEVEEGKPPDTDEFDRVPVNSPEREKIKFTAPVRALSWRVMPPDPSRNKRLPPGVSLKGELWYYFVPCLVTNKVQKSDDDTKVEIIRVRR